MNTNRTLQFFVLFFIFGQISCSSDKSEDSTNTDSKFDFNLRVYSPDEDGPQQLTSFGNSVVKLNDYIVLYNGNELFPTWDSTSLKNYELPGLVTTTVSVMCYDSNNNKHKKETILHASSFHLFETLPDPILLEDKDSIACEYNIKGTHSSGASISIVKMINFIMDTNPKFRIFPNYDSNKVYIYYKEFLQILKTHNLIKTDHLELVCKQNDKTIQSINLLTSAMQSLAVQDTELANKSICRLKSMYGSDTFMSELFIFSTEDIRIVNTYFRAFYPYENEGRGTNHFYTFRIENKSEKLYEVVVNPNTIYTQVHAYGTSGRKVYGIDEVISASKPFYDNKKIQLLPRESIEVYIGTSDETSLSMVMASQPYMEERMLTDITLSFSFNAFMAREVSAPPQYLPLEVKVSDLLREGIEARKNNSYFRRLPQLP